MAKLLLCWALLAVLAAANGFRINEQDNEITGPFEISSESSETPPTSDENEEDALIRFRCPAPEGLYRNPRNCSTFIQCSNSKPNVMPCPKGLDFSVESQRCEQPCEAYCNRTLSCKCEWKTCGLPRVCFLPKEVGPCHASKQRYYFNRRTGVCEQFIYGGCKGNKNNFETKEACEKRCSKSGLTEEDEISVADEQLESLYKCIRDGLYPNPRNCSTFIQCSNGKPYVMPCPKGLNYNAELKRCEEPCKAYCNSTLSCQCKWPTCDLRAICFLPKNSGPCHASKQRYFFNKRTGKCEQFIYGGCKGNKNNFETKEACEKSCSKSAEADTTCLLPKDHGPCKGRLSRYFYDNGKCQLFIYGGCKGNSNNFRTKEDCEQRCGKSSDDSVSVESYEITTSEEEEDAEVWFKCPTQNGLFRNPRNCSSFIQCSNGKPNVMPCSKGLDFSEETKRCEQPCEAYCNRSLSCKCEWKTCGLPRECFLPKEVGPCRANVPRYYFNKRTGVCEKFAYGGCKGNRNNFETKEACEKRCSKSGLTEEDEISIADERVESRFKCVQDGLYPNPRNCSTFIQCSNGKPYVMPCPKGLNYNAESKRCVEKCEAYCNRTLSCECKWPTCGLPRVCFLPKKTGTCHASKQRYFFNKRTGKCEQFLYGGCQGNANNFETKEECEKKCSKSGEESVSESSEITTSEEEDNAEVWFKCPVKTGLYRNPRNCSTFIQCSNGRPNVMPCPKGLHFSEETKRCEQPCEAYCNRTLSCKCEWKTCGLPRECFLPKEVGPCRASVPRYYFNKRTGVCEKFTYGGCKGNRNNFETKEACEKRCSKDSHSSADEITDADEQLEVRYKCHKDGLYRNPRNCSTFIQCSNGQAHVMPCPKGLQFSVESQRCEQPCEAYCSRSLSCKCKWPTCGLPRVCFLPKETGPCKASKQRYFFNKRTGKCEQFIYGGCKGNANNFETKEACEKRCSKSTHEEDISIADEELEAKFKCYKDGLYPNPRNCSNFIQCSNGNPNVMPCPAGLHYSVETKRCEEPCKAYCNRTLSCQCKWPTCGLPELCFLPARTGPCRAAIPRFFFNKRTGKCEKFVYGGCRGNSNNFQTKEACEKICRKLKDELATSEELSREEFSDSEEEHDAKTWFKCGPDGLFRNPRNCSTFIQCSNGEAHVMPCPKGLHFSVDSKRCERPCDAYCNRTLSCSCKWPTCGLHRVCFLPKEVGPCRASVPRFYFNRRTGKCEKFTYGGCGGNRNNFETKEACEKRCSKSEHSEDDEISVADEQYEARYKCVEDGLFPNTRNCSTFIQCSNGKPNVMPCPKGLHYSVKSKRCEQPCDAYCSSRLSCKCKWPTCGLPAICFLPEEVGPCRANVPRYYFNKRTGVCEKFTYGGCKGNKNNFETKEACEKRCSKKSGDDDADDVEEQNAFLNVCRLPKDHGPCSAKIDRFYFEYREGKCKKFVYGGCGGNENRFRTFKQCEQTCLRRSQGEPDSSNSSEEQPEDYSCPSENGDFPYPNHPEKFIRCKDNRPQVYRCPPSMTFSEDHSACVNHEESDYSA